MNMMNAVIGDSGTLTTKIVIMMTKSFFATETQTYKQRTEATSEVCLQIHNTLTQYR